MKSAVCPKVNIKGVTINGRFFDLRAVQDAEAATQAERARILALLETLRPMEQPYTRRDWALEQKGEKAMLEKILRAISEPVKGGE